MVDTLWSLSVFAMLCGAAGAGFALVTRLRDVHRTAATMDFTRLVTGLLVTFTALILGLLIASVAASYQKADSDVRAFSADVIRLASALEEGGPQTRPIRDDLRAYMAAVVASTWPEEPPPAGTYPKAVADGGDFDADNLGALLHRVAGAIRTLPETDPVQRAIKADCMTRMDAIEAGRWVLVGDAHRTITPPFFAVLLFWLGVIFLSFGLSAPRNGLAAMAILLVAICIAGAIFVLLELDGPLDGFVKVSSEPMRHAIRHLDRSVAAAPGSFPGP